MMLRIWPGYGLWLGRVIPRTPGTRFIGREVAGPEGVPAWIGKNRVLWRQVWWRIYKDGF